MGIYPQWLRLGLMFIIPVAFAVTVPAEALTWRLNACTLLAALARWIFRLGVKNYSGASA